MDYLFATILLGFFFHGASSDEVVIDQQPQETWAWTPKKPTIQMQNGRFARGWGYVAQSRAYSVCDVDVDKEPNNWLYSGYINVEEAQKVDITVTYHMNNPACSDRKCKTLKVVFYGYVMESDTSVDVARMPNPLTNRSLYRNISSFNLRTPGTKTTVVIPLSVKTKYIVFAFHDQGACAYLYSVKVSYNVCGKRNLVHRLVSLPRTIAPVNESLLVKGTCAKNSLQDGSLIVACESTGAWNSSSLEGRCVCEEGLENNKGICTDCPSGKYVDQKGNNCTGLPSASQSANATFVNETTVEIRWQPPAVTGESTRVFYEVICLKACSIDSNNCVEEGCGSGSFIPSAEVNKTRVIATNLSPYANYAFKIYASNRVSKLAKDKYRVEGNFAKITVRTLGTVPGKPDVSVEQLEDTVKVSWTLKRKNGAIMGYHVISIRDDDPTDRTNLTTKNMTQSFQDLTAGKTYEFQVYAVNNFGKGPKGVKKFTIPKGSSSTSQFIYIVTSIVLGIILLIVLGVYCYCQRKPRHRPVQRLGDLQDTQENLPLEAENIHMHHILPEINTDEAENDAQYTDVCETHTFELERKDIIFERLLGSGNFGEVHKAIIGNNTVAVKSLKENAIPKDKEDMITELNVMESLRPHPHVVKLIGCCSLRDPLLIVLEYLPYGDLLGYLRKSRGHADVYNSGEKTPTSSLSANDLLSFAWMIADGMEYLAKMKIVHRDLAARNILVGENKICKISDFGLARDVSADVYVRTSQARLPVKWMPPESLFHGESSTMSDVWSYGIVLWEVFTIGDSPYPRVKGTNMAALLERGYRMPRPMHISEELYAIMSECWSEKPEERPSFHWICAAVKRLIDDEKIYINLDYYNDEDYVNFDMIEELQ